jgi:hypothetical protein
VRYGPNRVSINSATALHAIYNPKANCRKSSHFAVFPKFFHSWSTQTIIDTEKHHHSQKRRAISQALHGSAAKDIERSMSRNIDKFCSNLAKEGNNIQWSPALNFADVTSYLSFDIMGEVCFGRTFDMISQEENRYILQVISDGAQALNTVCYIVYQQLITPHPPSN